MSPVLVHSVEALRENLFNDSLLALDGCWQFVAFFGLWTLQSLPPSSHPLLCASLPLCLLIRTLVIGFSIIQDEFTSRSLTISATNLTVILRSHLQIPAGLIFWGIHYSTHHRVVQLYQLNCTL